MLVNADDLPTVTKRLPSADAATMTIEEFCASHNISVRTLWNMRRNGTAPRIMKIGRRVLISTEAARAWREALTEPERAA